MSNVTYLSTKRWKINKTWRVIYYTDDENLIKWCIAEAQWGSQACSGFLGRHALVLVCALLITCYARWDRWAPRMDGNWNRLFWFDAGSSMRMIEPVYSKENFFKAAISIKHISYVVIQTWKPCLVLAITSARCLWCQSAAIQGPLIIGIQPFVILFTTNSLFYRLYSIS